MNGPPLFTITPEELQRSSWSGCRPLENVGALIGVACDHRPVGSSDDQLVCLETQIDLHVRCIRSDKDGGGNMRITVSHNRSKAEVIKSVDRSFEEMFQGVAGLPVQVVVKEKSWQGSILSFALSVKMGLLSTPMKGTVEVTDRDLTVDADLGLLNQILPEKKAREMIGNRIRGLLK